MHLAAAADPGHLCAVKALEQLGDSLKDCAFPVLRVLLAPARLGKFQGIFPRHRIQDPAVFIHQQQLDGGGPQINPYVIHLKLPFSL